MEACSRSGRAGRPVGTTLATLHLRSGERGSAFELTLDHIIPRSRGGTSDPENLCAACIACNQRKGNRTPDEARMPLLATPSALRYGLDRAVLNHYALSRPEW